MQSETGEKLSHLEGRRPALDPSNGFLYVTNTWSNTVSVIDGVNDTVIATIPVDSNPYGIAYDSLNGDMYVGNWRCYPTPWTPCNFQWNYSTVSVIDTLTNRVIDTIQGMDFPGEIVFDASNGPVRAFHRLEQASCD